MALRSGPLPFDEANEFLRNKINLPTEGWRDLQQGMHARAFTVAGAMSDGVLIDFRAAIEKAQTEGTTLATFQKDFDRIVEQYGWSYKGTRRRRARTIYETNLRTAHAAGRYQQMTRPEVLADRPYWMYRKSNSASPREEHRAWDGKVLLATDPWWQTHYPPNGWGCKCTVLTLSARELAQLGKTGPDPTPTDGKLDPDWAYNVGEASIQFPRTAGAGPGRPGRPSTPEELRQGWRELETRGPKDFERPDTVPLAPQAVPLRERARSYADLQRLTRDAIGGASTVINLKEKDFTFSVVVDAKELSDHIATTKDFARSRFLDALMDTLRDPFEVWGVFAQNITTGEVGLRYRFIKRVRTDDGTERDMLVVANAAKGRMTTLTVYPSSGSDWEKLRKGRLLYGKK